MKSTAYRFVTLFTFALLLAAAPPILAEEENETPVGYDTPEAAYVAARDAFNARDWKAFVATVSPAHRDEIIGQMAVALAGMAKQPGSDPRLGALVEEYLPRNFDPMDLMMSDNAQAETVRLAKRIGDPEGFFVDAMSLIFSMQYSKAELATTQDADPAAEAAEAAEDTPAAEGEEEAEEAKQTLDAEITAIDELTIDGDIATALVTITTSTGDARDPWTFERHEDRWYLSMR